MLRPAHPHELEAYLDVRDMSAAGEYAAWMGASDRSAWVSAPRVAGSVWAASELWISARLCPISEVKRRMSESGRWSISLTIFFFSFLHRITLYDTTSRLCTIVRRNVGQNNN